MSKPVYDVVAIGNAIVDVLAQADDTFVDQEKMAKGSMQLIFSPEDADALYAKMGPGQEISGGSAANTVAGMAALGSKCGFIGQVAEDQLGEVFAHDIRSAGIRFETPARSGSPSTARCLIFVTPDGQRTMNTFLGASQFLPAAAIDAELIGQAAILYLEGYLWDPEEPRAAMREAIRIARDAGRAVAFTLSDVFCINRHRADFLNLIGKRHVDILFANEAELLSLVEGNDLDDAIRRITPLVKVLVVTRSERGALAMQGDVKFEVPAFTVDRVVDTTGAGDLFAAGCMFGMARGWAMDLALRAGAICASEVISHYGARPQTDLLQLMKLNLQ